MALAVSLATARVRTASLAQRLATWLSTVRWLRQSAALWLRFVDLRPISGVMTQSLAWCCARLAAGLTALLPVWDNASRHLRWEVRAWTTAH
jgi:hypothetical protein